MRIRRASMRARPCLRQASETGPRQGGACKSPPSFLTRTLSLLPSLPCSLSNIGTIGGTYAAPVIPAGTAAIGALGKISKMPRYASTLPGAGKAGGSGEDPLVPAHIMQVSWSADHRFVDGATMARFTRTWTSMIESPAVMLAQLR